MHLFCFLNKWTGYLCSIWLNEKYTKNHLNCFTWNKTVPMIDQIWNIRKTHGLKWLWCARMHRKCVWLRRYQHTVWLTLTHAIQNLFHFHHSFFFFPVQYSVFSVSFWVLCTVYCCKAMLFDEACCYFFPLFVCALFCFSSLSISHECYRVFFFSHTSLLYTLYSIFYNSIHKIKYRNPHDTSAHTNDTPLLQIHTLNIIFLFIIVGACCVLNNMGAWILFVFLSYWFSYFSSSSRVCLLMAKSVYPIIVCTQNSEFRKNEKCFLNLFWP